jgi:hypothetical protein
MMADRDTVKAARVAAAMMQMTKFDVAALQAALRRHGELTPAAARVPPATACCSASFATSPRAQRARAHRSARAHRVVPHTIGRAADAINEKSPHAFAYGDRRTLQRSPAWTRRPSRCITQQRPSASSAHVP